MKMSEVADFLTEKGVRPEIFAIDTVATNEVVVLYQEGPARWVVFYAERGLRTDEKEGYAKLFLKNSRAMMAVMVSGKVCRGLR